MKNIKEVTVEMAKRYGIQYKRGTLRNFCGCGSDDYPDWFIMYEILMRDLKNN